MKSGSLKKYALFLFLILANSAAFAEVDAGYEGANEVPGTCPSHYNETDAWGFAGCNCTSYVAYRLRINNVRIDPGNQDSELFDNTWGSSKIRFGYAFEWSSGAIKAGIRKDQYPAVGSVAYWDEKSIPDTGHVAYVQHLFINKMSGKLDAIGIMEYNWADCERCGPDHKYRYRKIYPGRGKWPTAFLHFEEKGRDKDDTNVTCVAGLDKSAYKPSGAHDGTFCWKHKSNSDSSCDSAPNRYYFDYQTCVRHPVGSSYCDGITDDLPGYTAKIGSGFPEPIDPAVKKSDFAFCDGTTASAEGTSNLIAGRTAKERAKFWRDTAND